MKSFSTVLLNRDFTRLFEQGCHIRRGFNYEAYRLSAGGE